MDIQGELARARGAADRVTRLKRTVGEMPGLVDGELQSIRDGFEALMRDYGGATPRQRKAFRRELDVLAARVARAGTAGRVAPKHLRVLDAALVHARTLHFANVRRVLGKLDKPLGLARDLMGALEEYRKAYRGLVQEAAGLREVRERLRAVPKPPLSRQRVGEVAQEVEAYNRAARGLLQEFLSDATAGGLRLLLEASGNTALGVPPPEDLRQAQELVDYLTAHPNLLASLGPGGARSLLDVGQWSDARLSYFLVDPKPFRRLVQANLSWLKALCSFDGPSLLIPWGQPVDRVVSRLGDLEHFLASSPGAGEVQARLATVSSLVGSDQYRAAMEASAIHQVHGEAAQRRLDGSLAEDLRAVEGQLAQAQGALEALARPEELAGKAKPHTATAA